MSALRLLAFSVLCVALGCTVSAPVRPAQGYDAELAVAVFDSVWSRIRSTYYDSTMRGVNWTAARDELRPLAARASSSSELRAVIARLLARLGESHFGIIPAEALEDLGAAEAGPTGAGDVGVELRMLGDTIVVTHVDSGSPAARAGVRPGWTVAALNGVRVADAVEAAVNARVDPRLALIHVPSGVEARLRGDPGSEVRVTFGDAANDTVVRSLARRDVPGQVVRFASLPPLLATISHRTVERDGECVGVVKFSIWLPAIAASFDSAMSRMRECAAVVIDLRGNPGGIAAMVMGMSGYFLDRADSLGVLRLRSSTLRFVANPRRSTLGGEPLTPHRGRLAILVDERSASTSEIFAAAMRARGRARIFGRRSPGLAQPATMTKLPNGDALLHVIADFTLPDGTRIEANGVVPDVEVALSRAELLAGRDRALDEALRWGFGPN